MILNFSDFLNPQNILFFVIIGIVVFIVAVIFFLTVVLIFKFLARIFKKFFGQREEIKQNVIDKGEDLEVVVKELEESRMERQKVASENYQNQIPVPEKKKTEQKKTIETKEQKDIEEHLGALKSVGIRGFTSKTPQIGDAGLVGKNQHGPAPIGLDSSINKSDKPDSLEKMVDKNIGAKDNSIFGGKKEVSRIELRQKLRGAEAFFASKQLGLSMNAIERAKLEKEVFSQSLGGNISKTDLKWGIKKLNNKLLSTKNPVAHEKIRKQIKFFKKIGGIK